MRLTCCDGLSWLRKTAPILELEMHIPLEINLYNMYFNKKAVVKG